MRFKRGCTRTGRLANSVIIVSFRRGGQFRPRRKSWHSPAAAARPWEGREFPRRSKQFELIAHRIPEADIELLLASARLHRQPGLPQLSRQRFLAAFKAVEAYDPALNRWQMLPSMPHPRHGLAVGAIGNRLYTVSGDGQSAGNGIEHSAVAFNEILQVDLVLK